MFSCLESFKNDFFLVGGTAIALQIGHRESVDFDLASKKQINATALRRKVLDIGKIETVIVDNPDEYTIVVNGVRLTFFSYPFLIDPAVNLDRVIQAPDLTTLAAMKAYTLGRRAKWKDYVDLYFVIDQIGSVEPIITKAKEIHSTEFNEKNFRAELSYFDDIDYTEQVIYRKGAEVNNEKIKKTLTKHALT